MYNKPCEISYLDGISMLGDPGGTKSADLFHVFQVEELIPENHMLRRIDAVLDTSWIREELADCYSADRGRPSWDPEVILRMILECRTPQG